ncbi:MAG: SDR family oxidoreductase [Candidatus Latescibacteria bacterium]|nr:SDR family oxidoreductase [Candidatus Latescibacterota bacterium]
MARKLAGRVALVTGGGRGIGRAICQLFAEEGAHVGVADIDKKLAEQTLETLPTPGIALQLDVAAKRAVEAGFSDLVAHFGQLDILVNNAGILLSTTFEDCSEETWDRILAVNLKGTFLCCQAAIPLMKPRGIGAIVNMSSVAAKSGGFTGHPPYVAAKAGVSALTIGLARYLAPHRVRVNAIAPGVIDTDMTKTASHADLAAQIPLGEVGTARDVAQCALFLASDEARHITGEIIDVNGGLWMD